MSVLTIQQVNVQVPSKEECAYLLFCQLMELGCNKTAVNRTMINLYNYRAGTSTALISRTLLGAM